MGYERHHAIIVTDRGYGDFIQRAHREAMKIFMGRVSGIIPSAINGNKSFFVAPDGSKEGWAVSDRGDADRAEFKAFLRSFEYPDGSTRLAWVEVQYGDDEMETIVTDDSDATRREMEDEEE